MYLALKKAAKKWTMPIQNWGQALHQFAIEAIRKLELEKSSGKLERKEHPLDEFSRQSPCCLTSDFNRSDEFSDSLHSFWG